MHIIPNFIKDFTEDHQKAIQYQIDAMKIVPCKHKNTETLDNPYNGIARKVCIDCKTYLKSEANNGTIHKPGYGGTGKHRTDGTVNDSPNLRSSKETRKRSKGNQATSKKGTQAQNIR